MWGAIIGALGAIATSIIGGIIQKNTNDKNVQYQQEVNETNWLRDDTSIQRRKADLEKAGFNGYLAVNGGATTTVGTSPYVQPYSIDGSFIDEFFKGQSSSRAQQQRAEEKALNEITISTMKQEQELKASQILSNDIQNKINEQLLFQQQNETKLSNMRTKQAIKTGLIPQSSYGKIAQDVANSAGIIPSAINNIGQTIKSVMPNSILGTAINLIDGIKNYNKKRNNNPKQKNKKEKIKNPNPLNKRF